MGPLDLSGRLLRDDALGNLPFSQANDADLSQNLGVTAVVRLNEPKSDREVLIARGIVHGSVLASFTCEAFGVRRLAELTDAEATGRTAEFRACTSWAS